jgi:hypothetical protein
MPYRIFLFITLLLSGCKHETSPALEEALPPARVVATVYAVHSEAGSAACYRAPDATSPVVTTLSNGQKADLVSSQEKVIQQGDNYWLHIYPRLGHRPSCYININQLVPIS